MIFPMMAFTVVFISALLWLFGLTTETSSIWGILFSPGSAKDVMTNIFTALSNTFDISNNLLGALATGLSSVAIAGGALSGRYQFMYAGMGYLFFQSLGLYTILTTLDLPSSLSNLILLVVGLFNTFFVISFINWFKGTGE